jgi:myo-inositol-1(or 4)-monophosphatase
VDPLDFVSSVARRSGALLLERFGGPQPTFEKQPRDVVTEADRASEAAVVAAVREHFPTAVILGEEGGVYEAPGNERFIVDPLDGTTNYAHGYPMFCVSLGYERDGVMEAGAVDAPFLGLHFTARRGGGAFLNGRPIRVSTVATLETALVCTGFQPTNYERNAAHFAALSGLTQGVRRDGSAALDLAFVAAGRFDAFWEWDLKPWDVAAGALLIEEAGGRVTAIDGSPFDLAAGSIAATNGVLHDVFGRALTR